MPLAGDRTSARLLRTRTFTFAPLPFRCDGEGLPIGRESWGEARGGVAGVVAEEPGLAQRQQPDGDDAGDAAHTAVQPSPIRSATAPPSSSPTRGPPATTTMNTPCSRPRIRSGAADCRIVVRKTALTASAAPANAIATSAPHSAWVGVSHAAGAEQATPRPTMPTPQPTMLTMIARPWRRTAPSRPDVRVARTAPTAAAA